MEIEQGGRSAGTTGLRRPNDRRLFQLLRRLGEASKAELARRAQLTSTAVGTIILGVADDLHLIALGYAIASLGFGLFRPGTAVAVVENLTRDGAVARPLSDPGATDFVAVYPLWDEALKGAELKPEPGARPAGAR